MGETPQSLGNEGNDCKVVEKYAEERGEDLHFASDLFPCVVGKAKGQESSFLFLYYKKKKINTLQSHSVLANVAVLQCSTLNFSSFFEFLILQQTLRELIVTITRSLA